MCDVFPNIDLHIIILVTSNSYINDKDTSFSKVGLQSTRQERQIRLTASPYSGNLCSTHRKPLILISYHIICFRRLRVNIRRGKQLGTIAEIERARVVGIENRGLALLEEESYRRVRFRLSLDVQFTYE